MIKTLADKSLGEAIRLLREEKGVSLRAFAKAVDISAPHQSDIEHDRRMPSAELLKKMADALGVALEDLKSLDPRLPSEVRAWVEKNPSVSALLREVKESGRPVEELVLAWRRIRARRP